MSNALNWFFGAPRRAFGLICLACIGMLAFGLYLQHVVGLEPCPMCIVQRYALILVGVAAGLAAMFRSRGAWIAGSLVGLAFAGSAPSPRRARAGCSGIRRSS